MSKNIPNDDIKIEGIITEEVTMPKTDGTRGSGLYTVPIKLSRQPSIIWERVFIDTCNNPPTYDTGHRRNIARISGNKIILDGTTIEEVEECHQNTLKLAVEKANEAEKEFLRKQEIKEQQEKARIQQHRNQVSDAAKKIKWD